jgi:hypothetical protein
VQHLERALSLIKQAGSRCYSAWLQLELGQILIAGAKEGEDLDRARALLDEAQANARAVALPRLEGLITAEKARLEGEESGSASVRSMAQVGPAPSLRLEPDGEVWCLLHAGSRFRLANTKGVRLLARLLAEPCREFHALDLESNGEAGDTGSAGELLDLESKRQYQERISDLREQLEEADSWNDQARRSALQTELDSLTRELSRAFGFGGRSRTASNPAERARINVQRRLKDAIRRIGVVAPAIAKELERSVRTGTYCVYDP